MRIIPRRTVEFGQLEIQALWKWLFSKKKESYISNFESQFASYLNVKHASVIPSERVGISLLLDNLNLKKGDEVVLSAFNYHVIVYLLLEKGLKPVFIDIRLDDYNINPSLIESKITKNTKAIIVTHLFGSACDMPAIVKIAQKHNVILIEDVAHACGGESEGKKLGSFGDFAFFSFGTGKSMMTLSGGMVVSNNSELFLPIKHHFQKFPSLNNRMLSTLFTCKSFLEILFTQRIFFILFIYPLLLILKIFKLDPVEKVTGDRYTSQDVKSLSRRNTPKSWQAAIGMVQLQRLDTLNQKRINLAQRFCEQLKDIPGLQIPEAINTKRHVYLYFCISSETIEDLKNFLLLHGVDTKKSAMINCSGIIDDPDIYPQTNKAHKKLLELPCCPGHTEKDVDYQAKIIRDFFNQSLKQNI